MREAFLLYREGQEKEEEEEKKACGRQAAIAMSDTTAGLACASQRASPKRRMCCDVAGTWGHVKNCMHTCPGCLKTSADSPHALPAAATRCFLRLATLTRITEIWRRRWRYRSRTPCLIYFAITYRDIVAVETPRRIGTAMDGRRENARSSSRSAYTALSASNNSPAQRIWTLGWRHAVGRRGRMNFASSMAFYRHVSAFSQPICAYLMPLLHNAPSM